MPRSRFVFAAAALAAALAASSCTGFLRQISSDNRVDWEATDQHFRFDSRDLTLQLPGAWEQDPADRVSFTGSYEYDISRVSADGFHLRLRAEVRGGNATSCATGLGESLPRQGWRVAPRFDEVTIAGRTGSRVNASKQDTTLHAYCFRSDQAAMVYLLVSGASELVTPESSSQLLAASLIWK